MRKATLVIGLILVLASCGHGGHRFKITGRLHNLNQGEFYVYSPDGGINGIDTIKVNDGRFAYDVDCARPFTAVIVFPNSSEQPVFAQPGKKVELKGDATHLKELTVEGTKDNELMNRFRRAIVNNSPPETVKFASQFIQDHPESPVSTYLLGRYFLYTPQPDYQQVLQLTDILLHAQPDNARLQRLRGQLKGLSSTAKGARLPSFTITDIHGRKVSDSQLNGPVAVIMTWASWDYRSVNLVRQLQTLREQSRKPIQILGICLDGSVEECLETLKGDSITWPIVCDEQMLDGQLVHKLGLSYVPDNLLLKNGRVVNRQLSTSDLTQELQSLTRQ